MRMKKFFIGLSSLIGLLFVACEAEHTTYSGPNYVMFADTMEIVAIQNSEDWHDIFISATCASDKDRTYAVEVLEQESNAIEKRHYEIESNSVTIKAGELQAPVRIKGLFDNMSDTDSIGVTLHLINPGEELWTEHADKIHVELRKVCPFSVDAYTGYSQLVSNYFQDYMPKVEELVSRVERVEGGDNSVVIRDFLYEGYDLKLKFDTENPLSPIVNIDGEQIIGNTDEAFGTRYGDGNLLIKDAIGIPSFYNVCQGYVMLYFTLYVEGVGEVGTFIGIIEMISEAEANSAPQRS